MATESGMTGTSAYDDDRRWSDDGAAFHQARSMGRPRVRPGLRTSGHRTRAGGHPPGPGERSNRDPAAAPRRWVSERDLLLRALRRERPGSARPLRRDSRRPAVEPVADLSALAPLA